MLIEQVGDRLAGTCDVNRASGRLVNTCDVNRASLVGDWPALAMLIEQVGSRSLLVRWNIFERWWQNISNYIDKNASLKPPLLGEERVRDFINF